MRRVVHLLRVDDGERFRETFIEDPTTLIAERVVILVNLTAAAADRDGMNLNRATWSLCSVEIEMGAE